MSTCSCGDGDCETCFPGPMRRLGYSPGRNIVIEPSKGSPDAWYWKVLTFEGEVFAEGDGEDSLDDAHHKASSALSALRNGSDG